MCIILEITLFYNCLTDNDCWSIASLPLSCQGAHSLFGTIKTKVRVYCLSEFSEESYFDSIGTRGGRLPGEDGGFGRGDGGAE